jgi:hypothetical protein
MATKRVSEKKVVMSTGAAAVPARRKSSATSRANRSTADVEISGNPAAVPVASVIELTNEAVSDLAYSYWIARGCQGGSAEEDWLRAERELRAATASK